MAKFRDVWPSSARPCRCALITIATTPADGIGTSGPSASLLGRWQLDTFQRSDGSTAVLPTPERFTIEFDANGRVTIGADCNTCVGNLTVNGQTLTIGPVLACTRAACPTMAFENTYVGILAGDSAARIDDNSLTLSSPRGILRFRR